MSLLDFTVVGTAATVSVLKVDRMPVCGASTPVYDGCVSVYDNGGMGLNICAGLAALGLKVLPVLTYADYRQHDFIHSYAKAHGMPEDGISDPPEGSCGTTLMIQDSKKNHMTLITEYEHRLPGSPYFKAQEMKPEFFKDSSYVILTAPLPKNSAPAIEAIIQSGRPLALSMRKDKNAFPHDVLEKAIVNAVFIFANEAEVQYLVEEFSLKSIEDLFKGSRLMHLVMTLGKNGSRVYSRRQGSIESVKVLAVEPEGEIADTVGAGDGFVSGFMYGVARHMSISDCSLLGSTFSSFVLEKEGSITNLPSSEMLMQRFARWR